MWKKLSSLFKKEYDETPPRLYRSSNITDRAWRYYSDADSIYQRRINYFLVAESMLLFSFITSLTLDLDLRQIPIIIVIVGIAITFCWYYTNVRCGKRQEKLKEKYLMKNDPVYRLYVHSVGSIGAGIMEAYILPSIILFLWFYLLLYSYCSGGDNVLRLILSVDFTFGCYVLVYALIRIGISEN